jgi:phage terminase large subunit-like protein
MTPSPTCSPRFELNYKPLQAKSGLRSRLPENLPDFWGLKSIERFDFSPASDRPIPSFPSQKWTPLPHQIAPDGDWFLWLLMAGRGAGKTDAMAHYVNQHVLGPPCDNVPGGHRIGIVAPTLGDAVNACVNGPSGLKAHNPEVRLVQGFGGSHVIWPNGSVGLMFSTEDARTVNRLRAGGNRCLDWWEELAAWPMLDDGYDQAILGLRMGSKPRAVASTTPRNRPKIRELSEAKDTALCHATTLDNPHLPEQWRGRLLSRFEGTRQGRQELFGELITDTPGSLWTREMLERNRVRELPDLVRVVVGIDPSGSAGGNQQGIIVAGKGADGHGYVLADVTCNLSPEGWGRRAVEAYHRWRADRIVAERNFGGDMVAHVIRTIDPRVAYHDVVASRGKRVRAEPIAALYEQCVAHGSLVETARGPVEIQDVRAGEKVWTRDGLRRVQWAGQTGVRQTLNIRTDSRVLTCTADHPVYVVGSGFVHAATLVPKRDTMLAWDSYVLSAECALRSQVAGAVPARREDDGQRLVSLSASTSHSMGSGFTDRQTTITDLADTPGMCSCIEPCGRQRTGRSLMGGTCITSTMIPAIIGLRTSSLYPLAITTAWHMPNGQHMRRRLENGWRNKDVSGGEDGSRRYGSAMSAAKSLSQHRLALDSATRPATRPIGIEAVEVGPTVPVFDLSVDGTPEYFANGLLVHNCRIHHVGGFADLEDQQANWNPEDYDGSPDRIDALVWAFTELLLGPGRQFGAAVGGERPEVARYVPR